MSEQHYALGIDLGGTNLRVGVVSREGELVDFASRPIDGTAPGEIILGEMVGLARSLPHFEQATVVGIGLAGVVYPDGVLRAGMVNLPGLVGYPLHQKAAAAFERPCLVENDALVALVGEHRFGAGQNCQNILLLTLGTGVGGALLLDGVLRKGPHGPGAEVGVLPVPIPSMDQPSEFEELASPRRIMQRLGDPKGLLYERAAAGDLQAQAAIEEMYRYLGWLVASLHVTLDFELVILSGGLAAVGKPLVDGVQTAFEQYCPQPLQFGLSVVTGALPAQTAGVMGAAAMCFREDR